MNKARRFIGLVLAAYMLGLVVMPCTDNCDTEDHRAAVLGQSPQEHHEQDNDFCSPFCSCTCCALLITLTPPTEVNTFVPLVVKEYPLFKQSFLSAFADDCWQPPRLA